MKLKSCTCNLKLFKDGNDNISEERLFQRDTVWGTKKIKIRIIVLAKGWDK